MQLDLLPMSIFRAYFKMFFSAHRRPSADDGAAAVEFAVIAPVFIFFGLGIIAYGIYFGAAHSVQQLAADAARTSVAGLSASERQSLVANFITNNAKSYVLIDPSGVSYSVGASANDSSEYQVTIRYNAASLPIWDLYPPLPLPSRTISFTSLIRIGGS
jgi:Flp pilus assembly protein TadG